MPVDPRAARWVLDVPEQDLVDEVGLPTFMRGTTVADQGRVRTIVTGTGGQLLATVQGSERAAYQTIVQPDTGDPRGWVGICSCPVRIQCKHTVAVLVTARRQLLDAGAVERRWESQLAPLTAPDPAQGAAGRARPVWRLGLQLGVRPGRGGREESRTVVLAPVREGKGRPWVRQGVGWRELTNRWSDHQALPAHRAALLPIASLGQSSPYAYHLSVPELALGELGALVWPALARALDAGVELVAGEGVQEVRLGEGEAVPAVDLSRTADGGLTARAGVQVDDGPVPGDGFFVVGRPGHGVGLLDEAGTLTLWALATTPAPLVVDLLERRETVRVPPADVDRFLGHYYPLLARQARLTSADGSVPTPAEVAPRLCLDVRPEPGHRLVLTWSFGYAVPVASGEPVLTRLSLLPTAGDPPRDVAAELTAVARVLPMLAGVPELLESSGRAGARLAPRRTLTGRRTVAFATEVLPVLQASDDVLVTVEGDLAVYEEAEEAPVVTLETTEGAAEDWFDLHVSVTVAGQQVPFEELFAALAQGEEVMLLESGTWFSLDQPELVALRRLIEEARELDDGPVREGRVGVTRWQAGWWEELLTLGVLGPQSARWERSVGSLLALADADRGRAAVPDQLTVQLRPYQLEGFDWLARLWDHELGGVLADDMGLGKTLQVLTMVARAEQRGDLAEGPVLVVAPASVVPVWAGEAARFAPGLRVATVTATGKRRGGGLDEAVGGADLVVTSYTLLRLEAADYRALPWSALVLDEAQAVKNHRSATYQAARRLGAARTFVITGTPLENSLTDLWSMFSLAAPGLLGGPERFGERYRRPVEGGQAPEALEELRRRIRPFMLRRTKAEVAQELPRKIEQTLQVDLHPGHRRVYDQHLQRERQRVLGLLAGFDTNRIAIFRALTVLRQLALDPGLVDPQHAALATSAKITVLLEHLTELAAEGHRALVFSSFTGYLRLVREALDAAGIDYSYLDGSTRDRARAVERFREGEDAVFLISLKAGGVGLTLTEADYVFILDPWWNPAAEAQAVDRTHRIGQARPVHVYRLVSTATVEEKVVALQQRKRELFASVVDTGEYRSSALSADDIRGLLEG